MGSFLEIAAEAKRPTNKTKQNKIAKRSRGEKKKKLLIIFPMT